MSSFKNSLAAAGQDLSNFANGGNLDSLTSAMSNVGSTLTKSVTLPIVGIGAASVKASTDFGAQMSKVSAISGATGDELAKLKDQAIQLGADTNFSAGEAAEGMENMASAGFKTSEIIAAMPGMLDLAAAGDVSIADASDIASSSLRGFGMEADKVNHVSDVMAKLAGDTNAGIMDTGEAMKYIAPVANAMGVSFEDTSAAVGLLSNAGIKGSQAGTTLRTAMTNLAAPTDEASKVMKDLGMNFFDAQGKMKPFGDVLQILKDKTAGLTQQQQASTMETIFGKEAMSGMITLVGQGPDKFNELSNSLKNCDGSAKTMATTMQDNAKGAIEAMKGSLETAAIKIGDVLAPTIKSLAEWIGDMVNKFSALPAPVQEFIVKAALVAAAIGPLLLILAKLIESVRTVTSVFGSLSKIGEIVSKLPALLSPQVLIIVAIVAAIGFVVYEVIKHWDDLKEFFGGFWEWVKSIFSGFWEWLKEFFGNWGATILAILAPFIGIPLEIVKHWDAIKEFFSGLWDSIVEIFDKILGYFTTSVEGWKEIFDGAIEFFKNVGGNIIDGIIDGFKAGWGKLKEAVQWLVDGVKSIFTGKDGIDSHSPSVVFATYGGYIGDGLIQGLDNQEGKIANKMLGITGKIKSIGNMSANFDKINSATLGNINLNNSAQNLGMGNQKQMAYSPNVTMHVSIADTGGKGTAQLTNELKNMNKEALKNSMVDNFMSDALRL